MTALLDEPTFPNAIASGEGDRCFRLEQPKLRSNGQAREQVTSRTAAGKYNVEAHRNVASCVSIDSFTAMISTGCSAVISKR